jgi:hypothetical protein
MSREAEGKLMEVHLPQQHGASGAELRDLEGISCGSCADKPKGCAGGRHVPGLEVVLEEDGNAVKRAAGAAASSFLVERTSKILGVRVEVQDGVDVGTRPIIGRDSAYIGLDQMNG